MNTDDRLNLRARQILDDPTLPSRDRVKNAEALLRELAASVREHPALLAMILAELSDVSVREQMRAAIEAANA